MKYQVIIIGGGPAGYTAAIVRCGAFESGPLFLKNVFSEIILSFRILNLSLCALKTIRALVRGVAQSG